MAFFNGLLDDVGGMKQLPAVLVVCAGLQTATAEQTRLALWTESFLERLASTRT